MIREHARLHTDLSTQNANIYFIMYLDIRSSKTSVG